MKWFVLSMSVISTLARLSARAAAMPPNPPPMIKTRGRAGTSGKPFFEGPGSERHQKHEQYQEHAVRGRGPEGQGPELGENLHRDRPVCMGIEHDTRHELPNGSHRREQSPSNETGS